MEIGHAVWRKSSFSTETADCVEVAYPMAAPIVGIRDSKNPTGGVLLASLSAWEGFRLSVLQ
jgi:hypothetical protein